MKTFDDVFGGEPQARGDAPGRVNLLGEHTDYNDGYVLPTSIPQRTRVALQRSHDDAFRVYSADLDEVARFTLDGTPPSGFASYVYGCARAIADAGTDVPPLEIHVASDVPIGVGLSSSAALEIAMLRALRSLLDVALDDVGLALIAHRAENEFAGVHCGILDQMACSLLDGRAMLFLDTRSLERKLVPLPAGSDIVVIDSGIARTLASSKYNERRAECEEAARRLGVPALRDVPDPDAAEALPELLRRRARHVIAENARALRGAQGVDAATFGALMTESHASLRDDYQVSIPALDALVSVLLTDDDVFGAKLTGAGFGGACVALCRKGAAAHVARRALASYAGNARVLVPPS